MDIYLDNFKLGIARTKIEKPVIIIPADEIKKTIGQYMLINYGGGDSNYAYLTNDIKNLNTTVYNIIFDKLSDYEN